MRAQAYAPGRVELLGNHTDYNQGVVLGAAIDRGLNLTGELHPGPLITLDSAAMGRAQISGADLQPQTEQRWVNYALGVVDQLRSLGIPISGFSAELEGNLPAGSGLSSSAAFEVATALLLLRLHGRELPLLEIAKLCQRAEHKFAGVRSGLLDQVSCLFGQADHAVYFDARTEEVRTLPFPRGLALIIAESGRKRELIAGLYNERAEQTLAAANALGVPALRDVSSEALTRSQLPALLLRRAAHITGENERVWRAVKLLEQGDGTRFGALMYESHESSRDNFENSTPELDQLVEIARRIPGVLGARLTGGGFGGATATLCREDRATMVAEELAREYFSRTKVRAQIFVCTIGDGARSWLVDKE